MALAGAVLADEHVQAIDAGERDIGKRTKIAEGGRPYRHARGTVSHRLTGRQLPGQAVRRAPSARSSSLRRPCGRSRRRVPCHPRPRRDALSCSPVRARERGRGTPLALHWAGAFAALSAAVHLAGPGPRGRQDARSGRDHDRPGRGRLRRPDRSHGKWPHPTGCPGVGWPYPREFQGVPQFHAARRALSPRS